MGRRSEKPLVEKIRVHLEEQIIAGRLKPRQRLVEEVGLPNVRLQYDIYHMQRGEGELAATIAANLGRIGRRRKGGGGVVDADQRVSRQRTAGRGRVPCQTR